MNSRYAPPIPLNVVEYLESRFPDRSPELSDSLDAIRYKSGQASVARHLRAVYEDQTQNLAKRLKENY